MTFSEREILRQTGGLVAGELTALTGETWMLDLAGQQYDHVVYLTRNDGPRLSIRAADYQKGLDKLTVAGTYPEGSSQLYGVQYHKINVTRERGPRVIAREIDRRLMPGYLPEWHRVAMMLDRKKAGEKRQSEIAARLKGLAGDKSTSKHFPNTVHLPGGDSFDVQSSGTVHVSSLYLTPEKAERVIRVLLED